MHLRCCFLRGSNALGWSIVMPEIIYTALMSTTRHHNSEISLQSMVIYVSHVLLCVKRVVNFSANECTVYFKHILEFFLLYRNYWFQSPWDNYSISTIYFRPCTIASWLRIRLLTTCMHNECNLAITIDGYCSLRWCVRMVDPRALASFASACPRRRPKPWQKWTAESWSRSRCMLRWPSVRMSARLT